MIPEGWKTKRFAEVAAYKAGRTPSRAISEYWTRADDGVPWVTISDMAEFGVVTLSKERVTSAALEEVFGGKRVPAGTLLMSFKLTIGRVATLGIDACHNEAIISIFPHDCMDRQYLGYFLGQVDYATLQDRQVKGNTLNREKIDQIPILLPPFAEQRSIADTLDLVRHSIRLQDLLLTTVQELKRAAMQTLFTRGLRGEVQKETEIGTVPESWHVTQLGALAKIGNGSTPRRATSEYWKGGIYPWLTSAKVYDRNIVEADQFVTEFALADCHLPRVKPGAVLIAITGQGKTLGHCAVLEIEATINQHLAYVEIDRAIVHPSFIRGYLETQYYFLRQVGAGGGSTKGALTCAFLRSLPIPVPSVLDEQIEIATILDGIDRKIDLHRRKREVLNDLFKALIRQLMTGEIRVTDHEFSELKTRNPSTMQVQEWA